MDMKSSESLTSFNVLNVCSLVPISVLHVTGAGDVVEMIMVWQIFWRGRGNRWPGVLSPCIGKLKARMLFNFHWLHSTAFHWIYWYVSLFILTYGVTSSEKHQWINFVLLIYLYFVVYMGNFCVKKGETLQKCIKNAIFWHASCTPILKISISIITSRKTAWVKLLFKSPRKPSPILPYTIKPSAWSMVASS